MSRPLLEDLAVNVRRERASRRLTRQGLAAASGLSARFLAQVESGKGNISVARLGELAAALGTSPDLLLRPRKRVLALLGLRGAGKSALGKKLAVRLHLPFVELDREVEQAAGMTLAELFDLHGEEAYRTLEREALVSILGRGEALVLATGGSIVTSAETFRILKERAVTVWLKADPEDHWRRVVEQGDRRPFVGWSDEARGLERVRHLLEQREPLYAEAEVTVETSGRAERAALASLVAALPSPPAE